MRKTKKSEYPSLLSPAGKYLLKKAGKIFSSINREKFKSMDNIGRGKFPTRGRKRKILEEEVWKIISPKQSMEREGEIKPTRVETPGGSEISPGETTYTPGGTIITPGGTTLTPGGTLTIRGGEEEESSVEETGEEEVESEEEVEEREEEEEEEEEEKGKVEGKARELSEEEGENFRRSFYLALGIDIEKEETGRPQLEKIFNFFKDISERYKIDFYNTDFSKIKRDIINMERKLINNKYRDPEEKSLKNAIRYSIRKLPGLKDFNWRRTKSKPP